VAPVFSVVVEATGTIEQLIFWVFTCLTHRLGADVYDEKETSKLKKVFVDL